MYIFLGSDREEIMDCLEKLLPMAYENEDSGYHSSHEK